MAIRQIGNFRPVVVPATDTVNSTAVSGDAGVPVERSGAGLGLIRDGGKPPEVREQVRRHLAGAIVEQGRKLTAELPDVYRARLNETVETYRRAGLDEEALAGLRFAVAQKLFQLLG